MSARINAIDGSANWFEPTAPLTVTGGTPSAPSIFYPAPSTEVRGTGDYLSTAYLNTSVGGTVTFQIGTTPAYGLFTDTGTLPQPGTWTSTTDWRPAPGAPPNLALGTTYHWRMGFTPTSGPTVWGTDQTFRTPGVAGFRVVGDGNGGELHRYRPGRGHPRAEREGEDRVRLRCRAGHDHDERVVRLR